MRVRVVILFIGAEVLGGQGLLPVNGFLPVCADTFSVQIHVRELLCRFHAGVLVLGGAFDQLQGFVVVLFDVDLVEVGEADEESVDGGAVVLFEGDPFQRGEECFAELRAAVLILHVADIVILKFVVVYKVLRVDPPVFSVDGVFGFVHLHGDDQVFIIILLPVARHGVLHPHDVVALFL